MLPYMDVGYDSVVWPVNVPNTTGISNIHVGQNIRWPLQHRHTVHPVHR